MQPYGIDVTGDLLGAALVAVFFVVCGGRRSRCAWVALAVCAAVFAAGSLSVLVQATSRADAMIGAYHLMWVLVSAAAFAAGVSRGAPRLLCRLGLHRHRPAEVACTCVCRTASVGDRATPVICGPGPERDDAGPRTVRRRAMCKRPHREGRGMCRAPHRSADRLGRYRQTGWQSFTTVSNSP